MITLTLPYLTSLSVNSYLGRGRNGHTFVKPEVLLWGLFVNSGLSYTLPKVYGLETTHPFDLGLLVNFPRKFSTRSGDASNFDKVIRDFIAKKLGVDDAGTGTLFQESSYGNGDNASILATIKLFPDIETAEWTYKTWQDF